MYIDEPMKKYVENASSNAPTPGGGSVSALVGALGTTMASMAGNFTVGKKKFKAVEGEVKALLETLEEARGSLLAMMQKDTEAYAEVGAAYKLPKGSPERAEAMERALKVAMGPPLQALRGCVESLRACRKLVEIANPNLITDVGCAAYFLEAGALGAHLNVAVNVKWMKDKETGGAVMQEVSGLLEEAGGLKDEVTSRVLEALQK